jgi:hypothetical protein
MNTITPKQLYDWCTVPAAELEASHRLGDRGERVA